MFRMLALAECCSLRVSSRTQDVTLLDHMPNFSDHDFCSRLFLVCQTSRTSRLAVVHNIYRLDLADYRASTAFSTAYAKDTKGVPCMRASAARVKDRHTTCQATDTRIEQQRLGKK